ncbi:MAG: dTDP-3-amino-3,6-dideoxy-alpha-D-galactopyranose transaminase [Candidatus Omnitrophica bacterium ADurb.Bin292]|jgi:hypothetical protein|nr:MAG: dTDP-3-amino-3,6-dideoxy-alpha-D-galactopyranose transaminase [Candidatus Omnitrophica bacterium ADurb.Bin292]HPW77561.1 DegT/DnrJ/EryC1/StrS aminotransferase family protein [Candidatus Omnitrophota bacterium]HQB12540.1 DegT/DnrJ/EryC1/StrS aminotransferase family protein [Candidatus Omnitrophota bacterium]
MKEREQSQKISWPHFEKDEIAAVSRVLKSGKVNYWTGSEGRLFEKEFALFVGCRYAVALANGTVALETALRALGIGPGDDVIVPSRTFIASASCAVMCGARPIVADVDSVSQNITVDTLKAVLTSRTRAIIAVHLAGWPCDMKPIMAFARQRGLKVIEDCAQALGASYQGRPVGSLGHVAAFSFCQDKILTTGGEGGMLTTNDQAIWKKAWTYKDHGKRHGTSSGLKFLPRFQWVHDSFGTNGRMTEMQAAIGRVQLRKVRRWVRKRRTHAEILTSYFKKIPAFRITMPTIETGHSFYKYYVFLRPEKLKKGWSRARILRDMNRKGIFCSVGSCGEIYLEKAFRKKNLGPVRRFPVARKLAETSLMFLIHPTLSDRHLRRVGKVVTEIMSRASAPAEVKNGK